MVVIITVLQCLCIIVLVALKNHLDRPDVVWIVPAISPGMSCVVLVAVQISLQETRPGLWAWAAIDFAICVASVVPSVAVQASESAAILAQHACAVTTNFLPIIRSSRFDRGAPNMLS